MFRRKKDSDDDKSMPELSEELGIPAKPAAKPPGSMTPTRPTPQAVPTAPTAPRPLGEMRPTEPGRPVDMPRSATTTTATTPTAAAAAKARDTDSRKLIVGRGISLSGEITSCDRLVVEGSVEANLANCRDIDIAESGLFKGSASIEEAEIRGRFEGTLHVKNRLMIRATGRVIGTVRYGQIEIECGGQISGDVQAQPGSDKEAGSSSGYGSSSSILPLADKH